MVSNREIFRRTGSLFRQLDKLEQVALFGNLSEENQVSSSGGGYDHHQQEEEDVLSKASPLLRHLTELKIRNMCGEGVYYLGISCYMEGRLSARRFSSDGTISAKVNIKKKTLFNRGPEIVESELRFEQTRKGMSIYGNCGCSNSRGKNSGSFCPHAAALMVAWVRKPRAFDLVKSDEEEEQSISLLFEQTRRQAMRSLKELESCIENSGSSRIDDLEVLQKTYSKLRLWANRVTEAASSRGDSSRRNLQDSPPAPQSVTAFRPMIREFSETINSITFGIMSAIESKYAGVRATDLYNEATAFTFGRVLESFVENATVVDSSSNEEEKKELQPVINPAANPARTVRSWDSLIEDFVSTGR